ncbi:virion morphogenesis protein [Endozoicomonas lisbonensis]|uniref:Virion morphogenesis protein n=1 Tax=Endozoicomonas lisbonensis TaxID=3120522 RepID=A0ABV2SGV4_9GAMM
MSVTFSEDKNARLSANRTLELLMLPPPRRKRVLRKTGQQVRKRSRQNLKQQKTITGAPMAKRKTGNGRMFRRLGKDMTTVTKDKSVTVTWKNTMTGKIAYRHHHGVPETFNKTRMDRRYGVPDYDQPATRKQAKALIAAGFKVYTGKKKGKTQSKRPSQRWIMDNLTLGHAGYLVRTLRKEQSKKSWTVKPPARPFHGVTEQEGTEILVQEMDNEWQRQGKR